MDLDEKNDISSLTGLFSSFPITIIVTFIAAVSAGILMTSVTSVGTLKGIWRTGFLFLGSICIIMNSIAFLSIIVLIFESFKEGKGRTSPLLYRSESPTISGICLAAAGTTIVFGAVALVFNFGQVFVGGSSDTITAAYVMMILAIIQSAFVLYHSTRSALGSKLDLDLSKYRPAMPTASIFSSQSQPVTSLGGGGGIGGITSIPDISNFFTDEDANRPGSIQPMQPQMGMYPQPCYPQQPMMYSPYQMMMPCAQQVGGGGAQPIPV